MAKATTLIAALLLAVPSAARAGEPDGVAPAPHAQTGGDTSGGAQAVSPDIRGGRKELAAAGTLVFPNSSAKDAFGMVTARFGYYLSPRNTLGIATTFFGYSRVTDLYVTATYRRWLRDANARLQPFLGASLGSNVLTYYGWGGTFTRLLAIGEVGCRYYLSPRTGFDVALNLNYVRGQGEGFAHTTSTVFAFGLAHVF